MTPSERDVWDRLEAVHAGELPLPAFEAWLYATPEAEAVLGPDAYLELVARDYRGRFAVHETRRQVETLYAGRGPGALARDRAGRVAREFLAGRRDLWRTSGVLAALWAEGHDDWVPLDFVAIDSELDGIPAPAVRDRWDPAALARELARAAPWLEWAHGAARAAALQLLTNLDARAPAA